MNLSEDEKLALQQERNSDDETIDVIRRTRIDSKKFVLNQSDTWLNNMVLISFGLGGALIPIAATISLRGRYQHKALFWLGLVILLTNGIYLLMRIINKIAEDQLGLQVAGLKEEYYLVRRRNASDELSRGSSDIDNYKNVANELINHAKTIAGTRSEHRDNKINYDTSIATGLLLSGLYFVAFSAISVRLRFILLIYLICVLAYVFTIKKQIADAKPILNERIEWDNKIDEEEKRMTQSTRDYVSNKGKAK